MSGQVTGSRRLARGALLIALALVLQAIRMVLPLPPSASTLLIGSLVHMMLALTLWLQGVSAALLLCLLLPVTAYLQGQLLLPFLIPVVWLGNALFVLLLHCLRGRRGAELFLPAACKAAAMLAVAWWAVSFLHLQERLPVQAVLLAMSLPQLLTGMAGVLLAYRLEPLLRRSL